MCLFGFSGAGKTTLAAEAQDEPLAQDVLVIALEPGIRSIADRDDVMVWPKPKEDGTIPEVTYDQVQRLSEQLKRMVRKGESPFKTIVWDSLTAAQPIALKHVMKVSPTPEMPSQPEYGKANALVLGWIHDWCALSRERGINVIFITHAEEQKDEATGMTYIRMSITPGLQKGVYQTVDSIGYLEEKTNGDRKLLLKNTSRVIAKYRQPKTGPQLPLEIINPTMGDIIKHAKGKEVSFRTEKKGQS